MRFSRETQTEHRSRGGGGALKSRAIGMSATKALPLLGRFRPGTFMSFGTGMDKQDVSHRQKRSMGRIFLNILFHFFFSCASLLGFSFCPKSLHTPAISISPKTFHKSFSPAPPPHPTPPHPTPPHPNPPPRRPKSERLIRQPMARMASSESRCRSRDTTPKPVKEPRATDTDLGSTIHRAVRADGWIGAGHWICHPSEVDGFFWPSKMHPSEVLVVCFFLLRNWVAV